MADKAVSELVAAQQITATDLFVLEQNGTAKKLPGQILLNWLTAAADGHGGIASIKKLKTEGLADTYRITLADTTIFNFVVTNGRSVETIKKKSTNGLVDTYAISYNDGTSGTFTVTNGAKGEKGDSAYIWIKYAAKEPTETSHSIGNLPDDWIGIYYGDLDTAPNDWKQYSWFKMKGEQGDIGEPATLISSSVTYQVGNSGTIIPSGVWNDTVPVVPQGKYLWTRNITQFNTGEPIMYYSVSRMGLDGSGSVVSVANVSPDENGNVPLTAESLGALSKSGGTMTGPINMNGQKISGLNAPTASADAVNKGYVDAIDWFSTGTSIPSGSDLDTYRTPGKYNVSSSSLSNTLVNSPVKSDNFALFVFRRTSSTSINQMIVTLNSVVYFRGCASDGKFREWRTLLSDVDRTRIQADIVAAVAAAAPRNLLDNSDFTNLIAQAGILGTHGSTVYFADRWRIGGEAPSYDEASRKISFSAAGSSIIRQKVAGSISGKTVTLAIKASNVSGSVKLSESGAQSGHADIAIQNGITTHTFVAEDNMYALVWSSEAGSLCIDWIALYEGEYTAETLPEYRPKGYGVELNECQRYYQIRSSGDIAAADMRPTMRLASPTVTTVTNGYSYSADL